MNKHPLGEVFFFVFVKHVEIKFCKLHLITGIFFLSALAWFYAPYLFCLLFFPSSVHFPSSFVKPIKPDLSLFKFCFVVVVAVLKDSERIAIHFPKAPVFWFQALEMKTNSKIFAKNQMVKDIFKITQIEQFGIQVSGFFIATLWLFLLPHDLYFNGNRYNIGFLIFFFLSLKP